jgi:hypothetical protein
MFVIKTLGRGASSVVRVQRQLIEACRKAVTSPGVAFLS